MRSTDLSAINPSAQRTSKQERCKNKSRDRVTRFHSISSLSSCVLCRCLHTLLRTLRAAPGGRHCTYSRCRSTCTCMLCICSCEHEYCCLHSQQYEAPRKRPHPERHLQTAFELNVAATQRYVCQNCTVQLISSISTTFLDQLNLSGTSCICRRIFDLMFAFKTKFPSSPLLACTTHQSSIASGCNTEGTVAEIVLQDIHFLTGTCVCNART